MPKLDHDGLVEAAKQAINAVSAFSPSSESLGAV